MATPEFAKIIALKNRYERQIKKLHETNFPQVHDLACRFWEETQKEEVFKELFQEFRNDTSADQMGQSMQFGTYSHASDPRMRAALGFHFLRRFVPVYSIQYHQVLRNIHEQADDNAKYQMFLDRYCVSSFFEYLVYFLDEIIASGNVGQIPQKEEAFISYSTANKTQAGIIKAAFDELKIDSFLAHEDVQPTEEWLDAILEHLSTCTIFVPLISDEFVASDWTQQEAGMAMGKSGMVVLPVSFSGKNPAGFLARYQALKVKEKDFNALTMGEALLTKKPDLVLDYFIGLIPKAKTFEMAENIMKPLVPYFSVFNQQQSVRFVEECIKNGQVWSAFLCRTEMIPQFISLKGDRVLKERLEVLKYQIEKDEFWPGDKEIGKVGEE